MAQVTWTLTGSIKVHSKFNELTEHFGDGLGQLPLAGVRVRISAREYDWDPDFKTWGEVLTNQSGIFTLTRIKDRSARHFKVEVLFKDDTLKIYPENEGLMSQTLEALSDFIPIDPMTKAITDVSEDILEDILGQISRIPYDVDWITVLQDRDKSPKRIAGIVNFGSLVFQKDGQEQLGGLVARAHADLWFIAKMIMSYLDERRFNVGYTENKTIAIKYPQDTRLIPDHMQTAYADPFNNIVFLVRNSHIDNCEDLETIMHELVHLRNYQHCHGETALAWQLIAHQSTHDGRQAQTFTAFHEAMAEVAKTELYRKFFGGVVATDEHGNPTTAINRRPFKPTTYGELAERRPFTRQRLRDAYGIRKLEDLDHYEMGWISVFNLLLCNDIDQLDMNAFGDFAQPRDLQPGVGYPAVRTAQFSIVDLLRAFDPVPPGYPGQLTNHDMHLEVYLRRLSAINPEFDEEVREAYLKILDPNERKQPWELLPAMKIAMAAGGRPDFPDFSR